MCTFARRHVVKAHGCTQRTTLVQRCSVTTHLRVGRHISILHSHDNTAVQITTGLKRALGFF